MKRLILIIPCLVLLSGLVLSCSSYDAEGELTKIVWELEEAQSVLQDARAHCENNDIQGAIEALDDVDDIIGNAGCWIEDVIYQAYHQH